MSNDELANFVTSIKFKNPKIIFIKNSLAWNFSFFSIPVVKKIEKRPCESSTDRRGSITCSNDYTRTCIGWKSVWCLWWNALRWNQSNSPTSHNEHYNKRALRSNGFISTFWTFLDDLASRFSPSRIVTHHKSVSFTD